MFKSELKTLECKSTSYGTGVSYLLIVMPTLNIFVKNVETRNDGVFCLVS